MIKEYMTKKNEKRYYFKTYLGIDPVTGKKKYTTRRGFRTKKEASTALARLKVEVEDKGIHSMNQKPMKFKEVYELWLPNYQQTIKESTYVNNLIVFERHILPHFGEMYLNKITPQYCQQVINNWYSNYSNYTNLIGLTKRILKYAVLLDLVKYNPMERTITPKRKRQIDEQIRKAPFYDSQQLKYFLECLKSLDNPKFYLMFHLFAYSGMRKAELLALRWQDYNEVQGTITINQTLAYGEGFKPIFQTPKTRASNRTISLDNLTCRMLSDWRKTQRVELFKFGHNTNQPHQLIFTDWKNRHISLNYPNYFLDEVLKKFNLPKMTVHGFRHTHCSLLFEAGASLKQVQDRLGHTDINTTMNIYNHVTIKQKDETAELFANFMANIV